MNFLRRCSLYVCDDHASSANESLFNVLAFNVRGFRLMNYEVLGRRRAKIHAHAHQVWNLRESHSGFARINL